MSTLSILVPAHNEEKTIGQFVKTLYIILEELAIKEILHDYEVIVLNDGSTDGTSIILESIKTERIRVIVNQSASGIHRAFLRLYDEAIMEWVLLVPGDAQWPASEIKKLILFHFEPIFPMPTVTKRRTKTGYSRIRQFVSSSFGYFAAPFLKSIKKPDPGSIKILPKIATANNFVCNSVLIEIERMIWSEMKFGKLREIEVETVSRVHGSSSSITLQTLKPIFVDCCKMLLFYKLVGHRIERRVKRI